MRGLWIYQYKSTRKTKKVIDKYEIRDYIDNEVRETRTQKGKDMDIKNSNSPVAENIERIIKERGLKQVYVAERAGMSSQALCDILKGRRLIRIGEVPNLAYALGVEPNELYS